MIITILKAQYAIAIEMVADVAAAETWLQEQAGCSLRISDNKLEASNVEDDFLVFDNTQQVRDYNRRQFL